MKTKARLTASATPATRCGSQSGEKSTRLDRFLDWCDRSLNHLAYAFIWIAVVSTVSTIAVQGLFYMSKKGVTVLEHRLTYRVVSTSPAHGGDAWQTK